MLLKIDIFSEKSKTWLIMVDFFKVFCCYPWKKPATIGENRHRFRLYFEITGDIYSEAAIFRTGRRVVSGAALMSLFF